MLDVIQGLTRSYTEVDLLCAAGYIWITKSQTESSEQLTGRPRWEGSHKGACSLVSFVTACWEEKPVPLAGCYGVTECSTSGNILIRPLNTWWRRYQSMKCHRHDQGVHNAFRPGHWCYVRKTWKQPHRCPQPLCNYLLCLLGKCDNCCVCFSHVLQALCSLRDIET